MELKNYFAQDTQGNIIPGANCYLYMAGSSTPATGVVDKNNAPLTNPFLSDADGLIQFAAPNAVYDLRVTSGERDYKVRVSCLDVVESIGAATAQADRAASEADAAAASASTAGSVAATAAEAAAAAATARFLPPAETDYTTRPGGGALQLGDRYLSTVGTQPERIYKGGGWVDNNVDGDLLAEPGGAGRIGYDSDLVYDPGTAGKAITDAAAALLAPEGVNLVAQGKFDFATSKLAGFVNSQARTLADLFADHVRIDKGFAGLTPNDPTQDYSAVLNAIFLAAAAARIPIDGYGAKFYVRNQVQIPKWLKARNITLESLGAPSGDTTPKSHLPVVNFIGTKADPCVDWFLENITADGRRDLWPNIAMTTPGPEGGGGEDGGMHAFRLGCFAERGVLLNCSGINAGSAGLAIHNPLPSTTVAEYAKRKIQIINFTATGNREHGWFLDSAEDVDFIGGIWTGNGLDRNTTDPLEHGNRGARNDGKLFGSPFDLESYSGAPGSQFRRIRVSGWRGTGNAMMPLIYSPISPTAPGYSEAVNVELRNFVCDTGIAAGADRAAGFDGVALYVLANPSPGVFGLSGLIVDGYLDGRPEYVGVNNIDHSRGYIRTSSIKAILNNCGPSCDVSAPSNANRLQMFPVPAVAVVKSSGTAAATISVTNTLLRAAPQARLELQYDVVVSGATLAGGVFAASVSPPAGYVVTDLRFEMLADTFQPIPVSARMNHSAGIGTLFVSTAAGTPSSGTLIATLGATS